MESSFGHLMKVTKDFYLVSIGINEISDGIKNSKRFKIAILHLTFCAILNLILTLFSISNYFYSFLKADFLPGQFKIFVVGYTIIAFWILVIKIDMILAEIKWNLNSLKVFYFLINNIKSKHKLTDLNYNRLTILSRISQIILVNYGTPIAALSFMALIVLIAILSQKIIFILLAINLISYTLIAVIAFSCWICINLILSSYYKMRFDQINSSIKSIVPNDKCNVINKRREKQLINLIWKHKSISEEVYKLNLMFQWSAGVMSIVLSTDRVIAFYLLINFNNNILVNMLLSIGLCLIVIFGFGLTYLFSRQIKSAHQSDKLINSILCKFNMRLQFKFKVIEFSLK